MNVEIITIGDELLIGQVVDTNSSWMGQQLGKEGFRIAWKTTIGDVENDIVLAVEAAFKRADLILMTGGIGPTKDDITKKTLCKLFNTHLVESPEVLANINELLARRQKALNELTASQAMVPEGAGIIQNRAGTAPCTWFERKGKVLVSMPGVPFEMKWLMENGVIPRLKQRFKRDLFISHRSLYVANFTESALAMHLSGLEDDLPPYIKLAYLPASGLIRLRLTGEHVDEEVLNCRIDSFFVRLKEALGNNVVVESDEGVASVVGKLLSEKELTLCTAESCTGGNIARLITAIPGASSYFNGGAVVYSNKLKEQLLGVSPHALEQFGAVSCEVVGEMLAGTTARFGCDCAIAVSGVAGPGGGTPEKPVGTVWIGAAVRDRSETRLFHLGNNRENNIDKASILALLMLKSLLDKE